MRIFISIIAICSCSVAYSQLPENNKLEKEPYWISMINDSTTNYFEAVHAFEQFWSIRPSPKEEDDVLGKGEEYDKKEGFFDRLITSKKEKLVKESQEYAFDYKRFKQWQIRVEPWVREDGSITFPHEQLKIWQESKN